MPSERCSDQCLPRDDDTQASPTRQIRSECAQANSRSPRTMGYRMGWLSAPSWRAGRWLSRGRPHTTGPRRLPSHRCRTHAHPLPDTVGRSLRKCRTSSDGTCVASRGARRDGAEWGALVRSRGAPRQGKADAWKRTGTARPAKPPRGRKTASSEPSRLRAGRRLARSLELRAVSGAGLSVQIPPQGCTNLPYSRRYIPANGGGCYRRG